MRFTCDSCGAQYMISDEKVGPGGVKVRCKRCSHVILVTAAPPEPVVEPPPEPPAGSPPPAPPPEGEAGAAEAGLDLELGQAFENVFGGGSLAAERPSGEPPAPTADEGPAPGEPSEPRTSLEWYVAVNDAQVGPLLPDGVKAKWEAGEVGPDTLVWKAGMGDWTPLSSVPELAQLLAPIPRPAARPAPRPEPPAAPEAPHPAAPAPAREPEPGWKPTAASALAALASEELASIAKPAPAAPAPAKGSLVEKMELPEGGVEPTGMVPLHLKGVESTAETQLGKRPSARPKPEMTEVRELRKSTNRRLVLAVVLLCALFGGAIAAVIQWMGPKGPAPAPVAVAPAVPQPPAPAAAPPVTAPTPVAAAPATTPPAAVAVAPSPAPAPAAPAAAAPAAAPPAPAAPTAEEKPAPAPKRAAAPAKSARKSRAEPARTPAPREKKVAAARPAPQAPAAPRKSAGDPLLDVGGDDDLSKELSGGDKKRTVYVPPAPGSDMPDRVSDPQIIEGVIGKKPALASCVDEQRAADPSVKGTLLLRWTIGPDGTVKDVRNLTPEYAKQPVAGCITAVVRSIRFPKTRAGREVESFPFKF